MKIKEITISGLGLACALIFSYIEMLVPAFITIVPGVKIGLANIAVIFVLYKLGAGYAITVSISRVILMFLLFGNLYVLFFSLAGALFSIVVMVLLKLTDKFSVVGISVTGSICHNLGQIGVSVFVVGSSKILLYLPVLLLVGVVSGLLIGIASSQVIKSVKIRR